jgi:hypothetical protein
MKFFFDESGDFAIPAAISEHRASVVMGIAVSENIEQQLAADFDTFKRSLSRTELQNGEPKGRLLTPESANHFCDLLNQYKVLDGISLTPVTLDLSSLVNSDLSGLSHHLSETIQHRADLCIYPEMREQVALLGRQFGNFSNPQALRILSLAWCVREALHSAIIFFSGPQHNPHWSQLEFVVDAVQTRVGAREELVFSAMVMMWLAGWSRTKPFELVQEIHTLDHPIGRLYTTADGFDLGKMLRGNVHWRNSQESWGLQIADISASIAYGAVNDLQNVNGYIPRFNKMMKASPYSRKRGPGLIVLDGVRDDFKSKYRILM